MGEQTDAQRLAEASDMLIGAVENGPWVLIPDPALRELVGGYVADTCHSVAGAAGLDEAMEYAHDGIPVRLATSLPGSQFAADARERLARHLWIEGAALEHEAGERWDTGKVPANRMDDYRRAADRILAVITGKPS